MHTELVDKILMIDELPYGVLPRYECDICSTVITVDKGEIKTYKNGLEILVPANSKDLNYDDLLIQMLNMCESKMTFDTLNEDSIAQIENFFDKWDLIPANVVTNPSVNTNDFSDMYNIITSDNCPENTLFVLPLQPFLGVKAVRCDGEIGISIINSHFVLKVEINAPEVHVGE